MTKYYDSSNIKNIASNEITIKFMSRQERKIGVPMKRNEYLFELNVAYFSKEDEEELQTQLLKGIFLGGNITTVYYHLIDGTSIINLKFKYTIHTLINLKNHPFLPFLESDYLIKKRAMHKNSFIHE